MSRSTLPEDFDQRFDRAFAMVAFVANRFLVAQMRRSMVELEIDLESAFIFGTLGMLNVAPELPPGADPLEVLDDVGRLPEEALHPVRLTDLSQVVGIPRETVRRKLNQLRAKGWAEQRENGAWAVTAQVEGVLRGYTREMLVRFLSTVQDVNRVLGYPET